MFTFEWAAILPAAAHWRYYWWLVQVAESGLDFVIIRTAKTDGPEPSLGECGVSVTPQGSLTASSKATKSQVSTAALSYAEMGPIIHKILYYIILYYIVLYCIVLYCIVLYYIIL